MDTESCRDFFSEFARLKLHPWELFLTGFSERREREAEGGAEAAAGQQPRVRQFDERDFEAFFNSFSLLLAEFLAGGEGVHFFDILLPGTDELPHSRILGWLLDRSGSHGQKDAFLRLLLDAVPEKYKNGEALFPGRIPDNARYRVKVEESHDEESHEKKKRSRIDIELDSPDFLIFIEVKIRAGETEDQLSRYGKIFHARRGSRPGGVIFLTPDGRGPRNEADRAVAPVSWRALGRSFPGQAERMRPGSHGQILLRQFCERMKGF